MIACVGVGPGDPGLLTRAGAERIAGADVLAGFDAVVGLVRALAAPGCEIVTMGYADQTEQLEHVAARHRAGKRCVVVFMGDIHFSGFQLLERVERACGARVEIVPGISSAQVLAARARVCFDETTFVTFHRRGDITAFRRHLEHVLRDGRNAIVIPRPWDYMPGKIAADLLEAGIDPAHPVEVWERLTGDEATWRGRLDECTAEFSDMCIMLIRALPAPAPPTPDQEDDR